MEKEENKKDEKEQWWILPLICIVAILLILSATYCYYEYVIKNYSEQNRGLFGDMFGGLTAIFSGLAFAGIIITIWLQKGELELQRKELRETRIVFEEQTLTQKLQRFENTFFQLLQLHHSIVNSLEFQGEVGRRSFKMFYISFRLFYNNKQTKSDEKHRINGAYVDFYLTNQQYFGHYLGNLYNILKFIDDSNVPNKKLYAHLLRDQLSSEELLILFYNSLSKKGEEKFSPIQTFGLMKNLPRENVIKPEHLDFYDESAYGE